MFGTVPAGEIGHGPNAYTRRELAKATARREGLGVTDTATGMPLTGPGATKYYHDTLREVGMEPKQVALAGGMAPFLASRFGSNWYTRFLDSGGGHPIRSKTAGGPGGAAGLGGVGASPGNVTGQTGVDSLSKSILGFGGYEVGPVTLGLGTILSQFLGPVGTLMGLYSGVQSMFGPFATVNDFSGPQGLYGKPQVGTPSFGLSTGRYGAPQRSDPGGRPSF